MKKKKPTDKKISLEKLQMVRISNAKIITGGNNYLDTNMEGDPTGTGRTR
ncbi:MAG: hypothetical protein ACN6OB_10730 [Chryseobacterium jejuense]